MAQAYRTLHDVSFPRPIGKIGNGDGEDAQYETTGVNYPAGSYVKADHLTPRDQRRAESGDLDHLLEPVNDDEYQEIEGYGDHEPTTSIFVAEHEAEAHALAQAGHVVIPKEQELELASSGLDHTREYQEFVKEHGYDRRPALEAQQEVATQRVPDHILTGAETRTGLPHNRGPETVGGEDEGEEQAQEETPVRARPGAGSDQSVQEARAEGQAEQSGDQEVQ